MLASTQNCSLLELLNNALSQRQSLIRQYQHEKTNALRLFHGINEGYPGISIDLYGEQILIQSYRETLSVKQLSDIQQALITTLGGAVAGITTENCLPIFYRNRSLAKSPITGPNEQLNKPMQCQELGINYRIIAQHRGKDPLLFLDFRAARRWVLANAKNLNVLNTFSYTCGIGLCASAAGAKHVHNIDFAESSLAIGAENALLNNITSETLSFIKSDFFTATKQYAGLPIGGRRNRARYNRNKSKLTQPQSSYPRFEQQEFDLVILDPPRWAKSPFGTVDIIRDYPSLLKPALLCTAPKGRLLCTNNAATVALDDWLDILTRCAKKAGRPIREFEVIEPEADFPSPDGKHPLKIAVCHV